MNHEKFLHTCNLLTLSACTASLTLKLWQAFYIKPIFFRVTEILASVMVIDPHSTNDVVKLITGSEQLHSIPSHKIRPHCCG